MGKMDYRHKPDASWLDQQVERAKAAQPKTRMDIPEGAVEVWSITKRMSSDRRIPEVVGYYATDTLVWDAYRELMKFGGAYYNVHRKAALVINGKVHLINITAIQVNGMTVKSEEESSGANV